VGDVAAGFDQTIDDNLLLNQLDGFSLSRVSLEESETLRILSLDIITMTLH
jgi:hypothetical protein